MKNSTICAVVHLVLSIINLSLWLLYSLPKKC
ncbi:Uncharacterised protein [Acinetobacter baumannii]|nr:Uncharacterised protein [Acinetobacter baumannii]